MSARMTTVSAKFSLTVNVLTDGHSFTATCAEFPGLIAQGRTDSAARSSLAASFREFCKHPDALVSMSRLHRHADGRPIRENPKRKKATA